MLKLRSSACPAVAPLLSIRYVYAPPSALLPICPSTVVLQRKSAHSFVLFHAKMFFSIVFATLVAVIAASPTSILETRACSLGSSNQAGQELRGPFYLQGFGNLQQSGYYATADAPSPYHPLIFDVGPLKKATKATEFYLNSAGDLLTIADGQAFYAVNANTDDPETSQVESTNDASAGPRVACKLTPTCGLSCSAPGFTYNCLSSPGYQPDWRLAASKGVAGGGCIPFTIKAVPA